MKIVELILNEDELNPLGITGIGLVDFPAIEKDWIYMSVQNKPIMFAKQEDKHIITGPLMIPNKNITRYTEDGEEYTVFVSSTTIEKLSQNFLKNYNQKNFSFQHEEAIDNVSLVESWIITDSKNDKANALGFNDLPVGTWMVSSYVGDIELWNKIKNGSVRGYSIEGYLNEVLIKNSLDPNEQVLRELEKLIQDSKI